ncbi:hypothetical protein H4R27_006378, partial [Coemansia aciculifera]
ATDAVDEQELISRFPKMEYICGQPPRRPEGVTFHYARKEMRVQCSLLSELIRETWITQEIQYYIYMLTLLGLEDSRLIQLHLQLHFENKPGIPLPKIDEPFITLHIIPDESTVVLEGMDTPAAVAVVVKRHPSGLLDVGGTELSLLETLRTRTLYVERIKLSKN